MKLPELLMFIDYSMANLSASTCG